MLKEKSLKFKIVISMVLLSIITTIIVSCISIWKSSQIISNSAKESFALNAQLVSEKIYSEFHRVETNSELMAKLIANSTSIQTQAQMSKLLASKDGEYAKVRSYPKAIGEVLPWALSAFFYFDQKYSPSYDGAWFLRENDVFVRQISNNLIERTDDGENDWYYVPADTKKPAWSEAYVDPDINVSMITYSMPVFKNGFFLGVAGIDITLDDLNKILGDVKIYKDTHTILMDSQFRVIAGKDFEAGSNILKVKNGAYKFLEKEFSKKSSGFTQYKDGLVTKVISYSKLPNDFILMIEVPLKNIPTKMAGTIFVLIILGLVTVIVTGVLALRLGALLSKPINDVVFSLSSYAKKLSTGQDTYLSLSQKLAEGSTRQAASVQETSSTLEESASMIAQNNQSTKEAVILAHDTRDVATRGEDEMVQVVNAVSELKKSSLEINKITEVISRIAAQTNILALNAAVEAARAGDMGGGFAVVADEVRNLAHRTTDAINDITNIVERNIHLSETCESLTHKANESLSAINSQAKKVSELLNEISSSSNEQAMGISQITAAVGNIEQVVKVNATHADTIAQISQELLHNIQTGIDKIERLVNGEEFFQNDADIPLIGCSQDYEER